MKLDKLQLRQNKPSRALYLQEPKNEICLILDGIESSFNIGSLIRLTDTFALEQIFVCGVQSISERKLSKASRNLSKWVKVVHCDKSPDVISSLKEQGYKIVAVELCTDSHDYRAHSYDKKTAFILGNEKSGVSEQALSYCDSKIHIPMLGMGNSMNVSSAAAIVVANAVSQIKPLG